MTDGAAPTDEWVGELERVLSATDASGPAEGTPHDFGAEVTAAFGDVTVTVPARAWRSTLATLRDSASLTFFDWLSAVDEGEGEFSIFCHVYDPASHRHALVRTTVDGVAPTLDSV